MMLSVVIPARNEAETIEQTLLEITSHLDRKEIEYELIVVDDASSDRTAAVVDSVGSTHPRVRCLRSRVNNGFGFAVRAGLEAFDGDAVAVMMADGSDDPSDLVLYHRLLEEGYDCAFGSRFMPGATITDYPRVKLAINRVVNWGIRVLFRHRYSDTTNAFKAYRREVIEGVQPLLSNHFNLTVELPLKAITRGYSYAIMPTSWRGRSGGRSKLDLREMGSRYLFIVLYVFLEHHLSRGDYQARAATQAATGRARARAGSPTP